MILLSYCVCMWAQPVSLSKSFETTRKSVPQAIINKHPAHFYVLRYNKDAHDFTVEKRSKPAADIISFTALKMDQVNASWFNYEQLDYLFFEKNNTIYFVFEKVLNFKREVFLKKIDSSGRTSDFFLIATMDKEKNAESFRFDIKKTKDDKLLIIGTQQYTTGSCKKSVLLFDPIKQEQLWARTLPYESPATGYSYGFECSEAGNLYYILLRSKLDYYKRKYTDHRQTDVPVFCHELIAMACFLREAQTPLKKPLAKNSISKLYNVFIDASEEATHAGFHFSEKTESGEEKIFFLTQSWSADLSLNLREVITPLNTHLEKQLTFFDGSDYDSAADKEYTTFQNYSRDNAYYVLSERKDNNYYKEILLTKTDLKTGNVLQQEIIPRKIFYHKDGSRFKYLAQTAQVFCGQTLYTLLMENRRNTGKEANDFRYHKFFKLNSMRGANLVSYRLTQQGGLSKTVMYVNHEYHYIPLATETEGCDFVLYLNQGKYEKFAILNLDF